MSHAIPPEFNSYEYSYKQSQSQSFSVASRFNASDATAALSFQAYVDNDALLAVKSVDQAAGTFALRSLGTAVGIVKAVATMNGTAVAVKTETFGTFSHATSHEIVPS